MTNQAEIYILLTGTDDTFNQIIHAQTSFTAEEIKFNVKFKDIYSHHEPGRHVCIDISKLSDMETI